MTARRVLTTLVGLAAVLMLASPAAAQYPPSDQQLTVTDASPEPGQEVQVAGDGFMPGSTVSIYFESVPVLLATATVDQQGHFAVWVRIPRDAEQGWHLFRVKGTGTDGRPRELTIPIYVSAASGSTGQRAPAVAKSSPRTAVGVAAILVAGLIALTLVSRHRRRAHLQPAPAPSALSRPDPTNPSGATADDRWGLGRRAHGHTDREQADEQVEVEPS
ncbi:MAG TPA: hypothetical protein VM242_14830 [Acidimicrobiales bacterium]|jgi:hypothetical protein|nr:hypothetical protein [Acidimicrobiales bacterium]